MTRMAPKKSVKVDTLKILVCSVAASLVLWIIPLIMGKYAVVNYTHIPAADIYKEVLTIEQLTRQNSAADAASGQLGSKFKASDRTKDHDKSRRSLPHCQTVSPLLQGLSYKTEGQERKFWSPNFEKIFAKKSGIKPGGFWEPPNCEAQYAVTVIVGLRNRTDQLHHLLIHLHPFLARQQLRYRIVVVEQRSTGEYNRGKIFNIGYKEVMRQWPRAPESQCLILHDVDLLPLNDHNLYACTHQPRHMSAIIDKFRFQLPYVGLCGGAIAIQTRQFEALNGFSNRFSGWGGEDDDFCSRITAQGLELERFDPVTSVYAMMQHQPAVPSPHRYTALDQHAPAVTDGLNTLHYTQETTHHALYTHVLATW